LSDIKSHKDDLTRLAKRAAVAVEAAVKGLKGGEPDDAGVLNLAFNHLIHKDLRKVVQSMIPKPLL
jgi:hypothetical protein